MKLPILLAGCALLGFTAGAHAQASVTLVDWNHQWKFFHPMGTMPAEAGNFATTWFLPDAQYDSPLPFGAEPKVAGNPNISGSYDTGIGPGPLGYGAIDIVTQGIAPFGQATGVSLLTVPTSGFRYSAYFKTTFTTTGIMGPPVLEFLCDDGGFVYLDGVLVASINMPTGSSDSHTLLAVVGSFVESDYYRLDLNTTGIQTVPGTLSSSRTMPVNVISPVTSLNPGVHTLAISVHNSNAASSDISLVARLTALPSAGGCLFSATAGTVTRDSRGTGTPDDDIISAPVTVNSVSNTSAAWNVAASAPGEAGNVTIGAYETTHTFSFPVSGLSTGSVTLTFSDSADAACTSSVVLAVPEPPFILGTRRINGVENPLFTALPLPPGWQNPSTGTFLTNGGGTDRNTKEFRSESIDLTGVTGPVTVVATFRASENSTTSNFETLDNFSADVLLPVGGVITMLPAGSDLGDGVSSHATDVGPEQPNGPPNGMLNGYRGTSTQAPNPFHDFVQNYDAFVVRDELNPSQLPASAVVDHTFNLTCTVPAGTPSITLSFRGGCDAISETFELSGVRVFSGGCDMAASVSGLARGTGADPGDPSDDILTFNLLISGSGSAWTYGAFGGIYGDHEQISLPVSQSGIPQTVTDATDPLCTTTFTVTAPTARLVVTNNIPQGTTFTAATAGGTATSYTRPPDGTELGWTGGDADVRATSQPAPNTTARYLGMNGKTPAGDFFTETVFVAPEVEYVLASVDLGAYTTSSTAFEADDGVTIIVESSSDPTFAGGPQFALNLVASDPFSGGVDFYEAFKVSSPDAINYGSAAVPYPLEDFTLTRRSAVFARSAYPYVRLRISGGPSANGSEHAIVDNIRFSRAFCTLSANDVFITRDNKGDNDPSNDEFSATAIITAAANGASTGWTSTAAPLSGNYGSLVALGPFPVSGGPVTFTAADQLDPACTLAILMAPPQCSVTFDAFTADGTSTRDTNGTNATVNDDTVTFQALLSGANGGTGWTSNIPVPGSPGTFYSGNFGEAVSITVAWPSLPSPIVFSDRADPACKAEYSPVNPAFIHFGLGTLVPLSGPAQFIQSSFPPNGLGWRNPADGALTLSTVADSVPSFVQSIAIDVRRLGLISFDAELVVTETSSGSNFEASDTFRLRLYMDRDFRTDEIIVTDPYDIDGNGTINGYDDTVGATYDDNRLRDEFNRPSPGVPLSGSFQHSFPLHAIIPADAVQIVLEIEGFNNSPTEHFRVQNIRFTELAPLTAGDATLAARVGGSAKIQATALAGMATGGLDTRSVSRVQTGLTARGGMVSVQDGWIIYEAAPGFSGVDTFTYDVTDSLSTVTGSVTVVVAPAAGATQNLTGMAPEGGGQRVGGMGIPGRTYQWEYSADLSNWEPLGPAQVCPAHGAMSLLDPGPLPALRFYRLIESGSAP